MSELVSTKYVDSYDINVLMDAFRESFASLNVFKTLKPKMKVLIKVNLPESANQDSGIVTNPLVTCALIKVLNEMDIDCVIADSPMRGYSINKMDELYFETGMLSIANQTKCELNHNLKTFKIETPNGIKSKSLELLDVINDVDAIINVGKVKMDNRLGYLGATTNLFGLVPGEIKYEILNRLSKQKDFSNFCIDIAEAIKEKLVLNVLDAIVTLEKDYTQRLLYCIAISKDPYSLDSVMQDILSINKSKGILKEAESRGLIDLSEQIKVVGDEIEKFKLEDFALSEIDDSKNLHKNKRKLKKYFIDHQKRVAIDDKTCKGCGVCSKICPTGAIVMKYDKNGELYAHVDYSKCIFCFKCHTACPYNVVEMIEPRKYKKTHNKIEKFNIEKNN